MSSAFGISLGTSFRVDATGKEVRFDEFQFEGPYRHPHARISEDLYVAIGDAVAAAAYAHASWIGDRHGAEACIASYACNDLRTLLDQVVEGDGRAAARSARALFEHVVNFKYVADSKHPSRVERYIKHSAVHAQQLAGVDLTSELSREDARSVRAQQGRLAGSSRKDFDSALAKWGSDYKRQWSDRNLFEVAKEVGLDNDYDAYRVLSGVTHGSVGGLRGAMRTVKEMTIHRFGPDLELSTMAFLLGVRWWREFARATSDSHTRTEVDKTATSLLSFYPVLLQKTRRLDREWWPKEPLLRDVPVLAIYPSGGRRWFIHDQVAEVLQLATPPDEVPQYLEDFIAEQMPALQARAYVGANTGRPMTVAVAGIKLRAKPDATQVVSAASLLIPRELRP